MTPRTRRRIYLREAAVMLVLARLAVRFVAPACIFAWADRPPRQVRRFAVDDIDWVAWAVDNLGARPWMNALCLPRALAAHAMLRRRGIASRLCLGVARDRIAAGTLDAHAWVEVGGDKIVGGAEAAGFTQLAAFGGASP
jgi:Transglutaminase-like superfamily